MSIALRESTETHARQEMQGRRESTEYGAELAIALDEVLKEVIEGLKIANDLAAQYHGVMWGRRHLTHITNGDGDSIGFSDEEMERLGIRQASVRDLAEKLTARGIEVEGLDTEVEEND